jgi:hypothetical protein
VPRQNIPSNVAVHHLRIPCKHNPMGRPFDSMKGPGVPQGYCLPTTFGIPITSHTQLTARDIYSAKLYQVDTLSLAQQQVHSSQRQKDDGKKTRELPIIRRFRGAFLAEAEGYRKVLYTCNKKNQSRFSLATLHPVSLSCHTCV